MQDIINQHKREILKYFNHVVVDIKYIGAFDKLGNFISTKREKIKNARYN